MALTHPRVSAHAAISNAAAYSSVVGAPIEGARMSNRIMNIAPCLASPHGTGGKRMSSETAVVTGGASGFGLALATELAKRGRRVALLDRDGDRAEAEAKTLAGDHGVDAFGLAVDVADQAQVLA